MDHLAWELIEKRVVTLVVPLEIPRRIRWHLILASRIAHDQQIFPGASCQDFLTGATYHIDEPTRGSQLPTLARSGRRKGCWSGAGRSFQPSTPASNRRRRLMV